MSLEQVRNKFTIFRVGNSFMLNRDVGEIVEADDFIRMRDDLEKQIKAHKEEIKRLNKQLKQFDVHIDKAKEIAEKEKKESLKKMKEYVKEHNLSGQTFYYSDNDKKSSKSNK